MAGSVTHILAWTDKLGASSLTRPHPHINVPGGVRPGYNIVFI